MNPSDSTILIKWAVRLAVTLLFIGAVALMKLLRLSDDAISIVLCIAVPLGGVTLIGGALWLPRAAQKGKESENPFNHYR